MKDKKAVREMAEYVSRQATVFPDKKGFVHGFRKFLWMGRSGITDVKAEKVIVPALGTHAQVFIDQKAEVILAGYELFGWSVYSLTGDKILFLRPMSLNQAIETVERDCDDS